MTLSPTALEEAAKAMHGAEPWSSFWSTDDARLLATAAITAYLARAEKEGWVMVPKEPSEAMIEAGCDNNPTQWNEGTDLGFAADVANDVYRAMLSAARAAIAKAEGRAP